MRSPPYPCRGRAVAVTAAASRAGWLLRWSDSAATAALGTMLAAGAPAAWVTGLAHGVASLGVGGGPEGAGDSLDGVSSCVSSCVSSGEVSDPLASRRLCVVAYLLAGARHSVCQSRHPRCSRTRRR
jgi:hypothetical protein